MKRDHDELIEKVRKEMIQSGLQYGLKNERTIQLSIQLDALLNSYTNNERNYHNINRNNHLFYKN